MSRVACNDLAQEVMKRYSIKKMWEAAVERLNEKVPELMINAPDDLGYIVEEVCLDFKEHNEEAIKEKLFTLVWPAIRRVLVHGVAPWYKEMCEIRDAEAMVGNDIAAPVKEEEICHAELGEAGA